jgi:broad specificity phosphatase PhoE
MIIKTEQYLGGLQGKRLSSSAQLSARLDSSIESRDSFFARTLAWWNETILKFTASLAPRSTPYNVLVTSHGGFINTLVKGLVRSGKARCKEGVVIWQCPNSSITVIEVALNNNIGVVVKYGDVAHLLEEKAVETNADEVELG